MELSGFRGIFQWIWMDIVKILVLTGVFGSKE